MEVKYVFLDFDGTIVDAKSLALKAFKDVFDKHGFNYKKEDLEKYLGHKIESMLQHMGILTKKTKEIKKEFYDYMTKKAKEGNLHPCVSLEPLKRFNKKHPLVIISNSETRYIKAAMKKLGIKKLFKAVYGAEKFSTKDEMLRRLFDKYKINPAEAIYIGDNYTDVQYAKKAGCVSIAMNNKCSWSDKKTIRKEKPDCIIKDFAHLNKVIKAIHKPHR